jgi:hypothetical protein
VSHSPSNRKRLIIVICAIREAMAERDALVVAHRTAQNVLRACEARLADLETAEPPARHKRKRVTWAAQVTNLQRQVRYRQRDVQLALGRVEDFDRSKEQRRLTWMLRELLKQRRRMRRNVGVKQLPLPFTAS